jgi:hypothetical protein
MKERGVYGTVLREEGCFFLEVEGKRHELPEGLLADRKHLEELIGQRVHIVIGDSPIIFIDHILCYVPADPWGWVVRVDPAIRQGILDGFVKAGLLSQEKAEQVMRMEG